MQKAEIAEFTVEVGARLDQMPMLRGRFAILAVIWLGMFADALDLFMQSGILGVWVSQHFSTVADNATFLTVGFSGLAAGALIGGWMGDRYGRKLTMIVSAVIFGLGTLISTFLPTLGLFIVARGIVGLGMGAMVVAGYSTMAEFAPPRLRGRVTAGLLYLAFILGFAISGMLTYLIVITWGWRAVFLVFGLWGVVTSVLMLFYLVESPRWLASQGRKAEAEQILTRMETAAGMVPGERLATAPDRAAALAFLRTSNAPQVPFMRLMVFSTTVMFFNDMAFYIVAAWLPTFLTKLGMPIERALLFVTIMQIASLFGVFLAYALVDSWGRKPTAILFGIVGAVACVAFGLAAQSTPIPFNMLLSIGSIAFVCFIVTIGVYRSVWFPELFPTGIRMKTNGVVNMAGRIGAIVGPFIVIQLLAASGVPGVFYATAAVVVFAVVLTVFVPETKGRSLEAIERDLAIRAAS